MQPVIMRAVSLSLSMSACANACVFVCVVLNSCGLIACHSMCISYISYAYENDAVQQTAHTIIVSLSCRSRLRANVRVCNDYGTKKQKPHAFTHKCAAAAAAVCVAAAATAAHDM